jgi:hypothetical protein
MNGFAAYSVPLPLSATHRLEADFVAITPHGLALLEVKGGIVRVDGRPGPSVRWAHETRSGRPTGSHVAPAQLYRLADTFGAVSEAMTGVSFGGRIAQLLVFPHTPRGIVDPHVLAQLYAPDRNFARVVFAEDLAQHGIWNLVADELAMPGRSRPFEGEEVQRLCDWILGELDVRPGPGAPATIPAFGHEPSSLTGFTVAPPQAERDRRNLPDWRENLPEIGRRIRSFGASSPASQPKRSKGSWFKRAGIGLAILTALIYWAARPTPPATTTQPSLTTAPPPVAAIAAVAPPSRPSPTPDPFQAALTRAVIESDKRIPAGGSDWVRGMGPVTGRAGCQFVEMAYNGQIFNVVACREGDRGIWRY